MKIKKLTFINHKTGWNIKDAQFDDTTLLVGASGVGKTQILRALQMLSDIANGYSFEGIEWNISFSQGGKDYQWEGEFGLAGGQEPLNLGADDTFPVVRERLMEGETELVLRKDAELRYKGKETVKLDSHRSAIDVLKDEDGVCCVYDAFAQMYDLGNRDGLLSCDELSSDMLKQEQQLAYIKARRSWGVVTNLYLLKKNQLPEFHTICKTFSSVFPLVEELDFTLLHTTHCSVRPILHIKEKGTNALVSCDNISSGMFRALVLITALTLADDGDVLLIDEWGNGMDMNCIANLFDVILNADADIQLIVTSHQPYVIGAFSPLLWKVVTRKGSDVSLHSTRELNIGLHSHHDAFMELLRTKAYNTGQL